MTRTGDREIPSVSGKLPDNPGELARMHLPGHRKINGSRITCQRLKLLLCQNPQRF